MDLIDRADVHDLIAKRLSDYLTDESREELEELDIKVEEDIPTVQAVPIEAVLDILEKEGHKWGNNYRDWVDAIEEIKNLPSVNPQEPKWIHVSERLPEKNMACLVAVGKFNFTQMAMYSDLMETIDHRIFYQGDYGHENFVDITQYVIAWMPLPKPYKAESEE